MTTERGPQKEPGPQPPSRWRVAGFGAVIGLTLVGCVLALSMGWLSPRVLQESAHGSGWQGVAVFIGLVVLVELLWMPRMWALVAGAALFGPAKGLLIALVSDTLSAILCFDIARLAGRSWLEPLLTRKPRARRVHRVLVERRGALTVGLLRLVPIAHYTLVSYLSGLAGVRPRAFLLGNSVGIVPGAVLYAVLGAAIWQPGSPLFVVSVGILVGALVLTFLIGPRLLGLKSTGETDDDTP